MALNSDESTVWYSAPAQGTLVSTDAAAIATADPVAHLVPNSACPSKIAVDGADRVWFLYRPCGAPDGIGGLGVYDPSSDRFDLAPAFAGQIADLAHVNVLRNNPRSPNIIVVASNSDTSTVDVSTGTVNADSAHPDGATDLAVTSDGTRYLRGDDDLTSMPVGDPGSTTDRVSYDSVSMNESRWAQGVALSADDQYLAGAFGTDIVSFGTAGSGHSWVRRCETVHNDVEAMVWVGATVWFLQFWPANLALQHCDGMTTPQSLIEGTERLLRARRDLAAHTVHARLRRPAGSRCDHLHPAWRLGYCRRPRDRRTGPRQLRGRGTSRQQQYFVELCRRRHPPPVRGVVGREGHGQPSTFLPPPDHLTGRVDRTLAIHNRLLAASGTGLGGRTLHVVRADAWDVTDCATSPPTAPGDSPCPTSRATAPRTPTTSVTPASARLSACAHGEVHRRSRPAQARPADRPACQGDLVRPERDRSDPPGPHLQPQVGNAVRHARGWRTTPRADRRGEPAG